MPQAVTSGHERAQRQPLHPGETDVPPSKIDDFQTDGEGSIPFGRSNPITPAQNQFPGQSQGHLLISVRLSCHPRASSLAPVSRPGPVRPPLRRPGPAPSGAGSGPSSGSPSCPAAWRSACPCSRRSPGPARWSRERRQPVPALGLTSSHPGRTTDPHHLAPQPDRPRTADLRRSRPTPRHDPADNQPQPGPLISPRSRPRPCAKGTRRSDRRQCRADVARTGPAPATRVRPPPAATRPPRRTAAAKRERC